MEKGAMTMTADQKDVAYWLDFMKDSNPTNRSFATYSLRKFTEPEVIPALIELLGDENPTVRRNAAKALAYKGAGEALDKLESLLDDVDPYVRSTARASIRKIQQQTG